MVQIKEEQINNITVLDIEQTGEVDASGASIINTAGVIHVELSTTPGNNSIWISDDSPSLPKFTDSTGATITLGSGSGSTPDLSAVLAEGNSATDNINLTGTVNATDGYFSNSLNVKDKFTFSDLGFPEFAFATIGNTVSNAYVDLRGSSIMQWNDFNGPYVVGHTWMQIGAPAGNVTSGSGPTITAVHDLYMDVGEDLQIQVTDQLSIITPDLSIIGDGYISGDFTIGGDLAFSGYSNTAAGLTIGKGTTAPFPAIGNNVVLGPSNGVGLTTGDLNNVYIGNAVGARGDNNIAIGQDILAAAGASAANNIGIGRETLQIITSGTGHIGIGSQALKNLTSGLSNIAIGLQAGTAIQFGLTNVAIGNQAFSGAAGNAGNNNIALGSQTLTTFASGTGGSNNVVIGNQTGSTLAGGSNNIFIGNGTNPGYGTVSNNVIIGSSLSGLSSAVLADVDNFANIAGMIANDFNNSGGGNYGFGFVSKDDIVAATSKVTIRSSASTNPILALGSSSYQSKLFAGTATPVSTVTGAPGDLYIMINGTSSTMYQHRGSTSDNTTWSVLGSGGSQTLAQTLNQGNTTDGYDIVLTSGSTINGTDNANIDLSTSITLSPGSGASAGSTFIYGANHSSATGGLISLQAGGSLSGAGGDVLIKAGNSSVSPGDTIVTMTNSGGHFTVTTESSGTAIDIDQTTRTVAVTEMLTVGGGLKMTEHTTKPASGTSTTGVVWVQDDGYLMFTNQNNTDSNLSLPVLGQIAEASGVPANVAGYSTQRKRSADGALITRLSASGYEARLHTVTNTAAAATVQVAELHLENNTTSDIAVLVVAANSTAANQCSVTARMLVTVNGSGVVTVQSNTLATPDALPASEPSGGWVVYSTLLNTTTATNKLRVTVTSATTNAIRWRAILNAEVTE